jgi:hypothetical protein
VQRLHPSRSYLAPAGPKGKRKIVLTFFLAHGARISFVVRQLSPDCRLVGRFSVRGTKGVNHVPFYGRVGGKVLVPGTYRIAAHAAQTAPVAHVTIIVSDRPNPTLSEVRAARSANVCAGLTLDSALSTGGSAHGGATSASGSPPSVAVLAAGSGDSVSVPEVDSGSVLGTAVTKVGRGIQPLLVALLAIAIVLLGITSLSQPAFLGPRLNDTVARHRLELAATGAAALIAVALVFLLG